MLKIIESQLQLSTSDQKKIETERNREENKKITSEQ